MLLRSALSWGVGGVLVGSADPSRGAFSGAIWFGVVVVAFGVGIAVLAYVRRRLRRTTDPKGAPFSLDDLRRLHGSGELTDEEFVRLRTGLIRSFRESDDA